jgi:hypothetical protein
LVFPVRAPTIQSALKTAGLCFGFGFHFRLPFLRSLRRFSFSGSMVFVRLDNAFSILVFCGSGCSAQSSVVPLVFSFVPQSFVWSSSRMAKSRVMFGFWLCWTAVGPA